MRLVIPRLFVRSGFTAASLLLITIPAGAADRPVSFNRDIRPIMSDTCFRCHGPDKSSRMMGLRLDIREEATKKTKSGVTPIVPGKPEESAIVARIFATDNRVMPPPYAHKELKDSQKETIRRWVAEGAKYEGHWAYQPVTHPAPPSVTGLVSEANDPIDAFIQQRLAAEGLKPSPEADRRTLIRRVTLDLTGLPPTPQEVDAFVNDKSADAYTKVVDRLLTSPRYAEQRAMHWLDAVRYADTAGYHGDNIVPIWPYRDYVLRAFRDNKPFDEFTREQIAGDLIPNATDEQKIASAYNRLGRMSAEGGIQPKEYIAKYGADRVRTVSVAWLGSTLGCAECHDHKFDPFLTRDFYSMKAFFADVKEKGLVSDRGAEAWGSKLALPTPEQKAKLDELDAQIKEATDALDEKAKSLIERRAEWEQTITKEHEAGKLAWVFAHPLSAESTGGAELKIYNDEPLDSSFYISVNGPASLVSERKRGNGVVVAAGPNPDNPTYTVRFKPGAGKWGSLGVEVFQDESLPGSRLARGSDRFVLTEIEAEVAEPGQSARRIPVVLATSDGIGEMPENGALNAIDGNPATGWSVSFGEARNPFIALRFAEPITTNGDAVVTVRLHHDSSYRRAAIGRFRVALSPSRYSWPESGDSRPKGEAPPSENYTLTIPIDLGLPRDVTDALKIPVESRNDKQQELVTRHFEWSVPELESDYIHLAKLDAERRLLNGSVTQVLITEATTPRATRILPRGDWANDSGELVTPAIPKFLGKLDTGDRRATRLDLANWLVSDKNPLTARVFINHLWREFFGTGISKILEDFGSQGESPVHPELLDWLASEFMHPTWQADGTHAWDVKHIVRTIVLSHTYRQSSVSSPQLDEKDPDNRLIARQSRFRVDAEVVHDIALAASGLLVEQFGGPSVKPYQPDGYYTPMNFPKREYSASHNQELYRRGVYTIWQRTFLHPAMANFDAPSREECTVNRVNSNTPLQSLDLLNDPIYVEAARVLAEGMLSHGGKSNTQRIDWAFQRALNRPATKAEIAVLDGLHFKALTEFRASPDSAQKLIHLGESPVPKDEKPVELAAMTTVARAILNLHETITRN